MSMVIIITEVHQDTMPFTAFTTIPVMVGEIETAKSELEEV
jgi:hypothetical protein